MLSTRPNTKIRLAFIAVIATALLFLFLFFSIGVKTRKDAYAESKALAREISFKVANETSVYLSSALSSAHSLVDKALVYKRSGGNREDILSMLQNEILQNPNAMGAWTMWEPNAFDGRDEYYRNDMTYDLQGTMSIAYFKYGDSVFCERNDSGDFQEDFYTAPRETEKDLILEPFHYIYHGHPHVFYQTSAVVPIMDDGEFLGVFGVDINIDSLQARFSKIRLYETGYLTLISGNGIIISHKDSSLIDKNFLALLNNIDKSKYDSLAMNQEFAVETVSEFSQERVFRFFYPVSVGEGTKAWYIMVEIPVNLAAGRSRQLMNTAFGTLGLGLLLLFYLVINIYDRRRYDRVLLNSIQKVEESNRIVTISETRFRTIFENANDAILIMNKLVIVDCNLITCAMFGCAKEDIVGKTPQHFSPVIQPNGIKSTKYALQMVNMALEGIPGRFEWQHKRPDGSLFYAEVSLSMLKLPDSKLIQAIVRDITDRKITEAETLDKKERLQLFVNSLTDWTYSVRISDGNWSGFHDKEGQEGFISLTGYRPDEVEMSIEGVRKLIFVDDQDMYLRVMEELSSGRSVPPFEYRLNHRSGTVRWVRNHSIVRYDEKGSFIGYDALVTDITERRNAEAALQKSERNFRNIFEKTNHGIIIVGMDGRILAANTAFSTVSGYAFDPSGILKVTDFVVPDQLEKLHERIAQRYNQVNLPPFEYKAMYNDGKLHVIEADGSMMDFNGQDAILVVLRDVTGVREAEQRVMEAIIQTEEAERSRIAQDLHDGLGPVLSTIKLYFQVYKDSSDAAKKEFLIEKLKTTIDEAIKAVSEISRNLSPHVLRNYGFYAAMLQFIHQIEHVNLIAFSVDFGNEPAMNSNTSIFLYRAVSELINNSIKHSGCSNISLRISVEKGSLIVEYGDDGQGFDVESVRANHASGSGLQNIINRIQALNGKVILQRGEIAGMRTIFTIPV